MAFFSAFFPVVHGDAPEDKVENEEQQPEKEEEVETEVDKPEQEQAQEQEEEDEPEDVHPQIREECQQSDKCAPLAKHFHHCQEKVEAGHGFKHEDCVEELCKFLFVQNGDLLNRLFESDRSSTSSHDALRRQLCCAKIVLKAALEDVREGVVDLCKNLFDAESLRLCTSRTFLLDTLFEITMS